MRLLVVELRAMMAAVVFFSRLPMPSRPLLHADDMRRAATYWPLVGLATGSAMAVAWLLAARVWLAAGVTLAVGMLATGALEQDGIADVADGFAGGPDRDRILEVMHDSRLGSAGVIAVTILAASRWQALSSLPAAIIPAMLVAAQTVSRAAAVALMAFLPYLRGEVSRARPVVGRLPPARLAVTAVVGLIPLLLLPPPLRPIAALACAAALVVCVIWLGHRLGGYTGDCVGAAQQIVELALLLAPLTMA